MGKRRMTIRTDPPAVREVSVRELGRETASVLASVARGERAVIVRHGEPVALILSLDEAIDVFLAHAEEYVRMRLDARRDLESWSP